MGRLERVNANHGFDLFVGWKMKRMKNQQSRRVLFACRYRIFQIEHDGIRPINKRGTQHPRIRARHKEHAPASFHKNFSQLSPSPPALRSTADWTLARIA